jgi:O-antigen ligase
VLCDVRPAEPELRLRSRDRERIVLEGRDRTVRKEPLFQQLMRDNVVAIIVAMVLLIPLMAPVSQELRVWRNALFQGFGVLLLLAVLARPGVRAGRGGLSRLGALLRSGVTCPLLLYFCWAALSVTRAPCRAFSVNELLLLGAGALICLVVSWHVESRGQLQMLCQALVLILVLSLFFGLFIQASPGEAGLCSSFGSRMMFGAFLAMMTPLLTALAMAEGAGSGPSARADDATRMRRLFLEALAVLAGLSLLLTQCRSAWAGGSVGLLFVALVSRLCAARSAGGARRARMATGGTRGVYLLLTVLFSGVLIFRLGAASDVLRERVSTVRSAARGGDPSFNWRLDKWRRALPLIAARPFAGWGLGSYPFHQASANGPGSSPAVVAMAGVSLDEQAHNEYVQMAVELGLVGLMLYLLLLASFFAKAVQALGQLPDGRRKLVLLGCMAGVVAQMVDAIGNPAWRYPQCSLFFWLLLGLGTACVRMACAMPAVRPYAGVRPRRHETNPRPECRSKRDDKETRGQRTEINSSR